MERLSSSLLALAILGTAFVLIPDWHGTLTLIWWDAVVHYPKAFVLGLAALASAIWLAGRDRRARFTAPVLVGFLVYFVAGAFSSVINVTHPGKALPALALDGAALALAMGSAELSASDPRWRSRLARLVVGAATLVSSIALLEAMGLELPWSFTSRPVSTLGARTSVSAYAGMALPLSIVVAMQSRRAIAVVSPPILLVATLLFRVKSAWVGLLVTVLVAAFVGRRKIRRARFHVPARRVALSLVPAVLALAFLPWPGLRWTDSSGALAVAGDVMSPSSPSGKFRKEQYLSGVRMLEDYASLGVGAGNWSTLEPRYRLSTLGEPTPKGWMHSSPHSDGLRIFTERGLVGGLGFLLLVLGMAAALASRGDSPDDRLDLGAGLAFLFILVNGLFFYPLARPEGLAVTALLVGVIGSRPSEPRPRGVGARVALTGMALAACLVLFLQNLAVLPWRSGVSVDSLKTSQAIFPHPYFDVFLGWYAIREGRCLEVAGRLADAVSWEPHRPETMEYQAKCLSR